MDIAVLGLDIRSASAVKAASDLDKVTAAAGKAEVQAKKTSAATAQVGSAAGGSSNGLRMMSQQLSQVAQQGAATGNYMQALSIQLPDLLLGFGLWGTAIGAASAVLLPMATNLFAAGDAARSFADDMDAITGAMDNVKAAQDIMSMSLVDLYDKYGLYALQVRQAAAALAELRVAQAEATMAEMVNAASDAMDRYKTLQGGFSTSKIMDDLEISREGAIALRIAMQDLEHSMTFADRVRSMDAIKTALDDAGISASQLPPELMNALAEGRELEIAMAALKKTTEDAAAAAAAIDDGIPGSGWLDGPISAAANLASQLWEAARAKAAAVGGGAPQRDDMTYGNLDWAYSKKGFGRLTGEQLLGLPEPRKVGGGRKGGGGGVSEEQKRQNDLLKEAERIFEETRTEAEKYAAELADLNELQKLGHLDAETYARAVQSIKEQYLDAGDAAQFWKDQAQDLKDGFLDAIVAGGDLSDVFNSLAQSIAKAALEAAIFGTGPLAGGGGAGGFLANLFGGFRANGGPVSSGKAYVVGERGPELFVPKAAGGIVPNHSLGRSQSGQVEVVITMDESTGKLGAFVDRRAMSAATGVVGQYDKHALPQRMKQISADGRRIG